MTAAVGTGYVTFAEVNNRTFKNNLPNDEDTRFHTFTLTVENGGQNTQAKIHFVKILIKRNNALVVTPVTPDNINDPTLVTTNALAFLHCKGSSRTLYCHNTMQSKLTDVQYISVATPNDRKDHYFSGIGNGKNSGITIQGKDEDSLIKLFHETVKHALGQ